MTNGKDAIEKIKVTICFFVYCYIFTCQRTPLARRDCSELKSKSFSCDGSHQAISLSNVFKAQNAALAPFSKTWKD